MPFIDLDKVVPEVDYNEATGKEVHSIMVMYRESKEVDLPCNPEEVATQLREAVNAMANRRRHAAEIVLNMKQFLKRRFDDLLHGVRNENTRMLVSQTYRHMRDELQAAEQLLVGSTSPALPEADGAGQYTDRYNIATPYDVNEESEHSFINNYMDSNPVLAVGATTVVVAHPSNREYRWDHMRARWRWDGISGAMFDSDPFSYRRVAPHAPASPADWSPAPPQTVPPPPRTRRVARYIGPGDNIFASEESEGARRTREQAEANYNAREEQRRRERIADISDWSQSVVGIEAQYRIDPRMVPPDVRSDIVDHYAAVQAGAVDRVIARREEEDTITYSGESNSIHAMNQIQASIRAAGLYDRVMARNSVIQQEAAAVTMEEVREVTGERPTPW